MHIHILGICGTFMGGVALIAKQAGHKVTGSDLNVYPPMSDQLRQAGIDIVQGFDAEQLDCKPDLIVAGNIMKRGMSVIERMLDEKLPYMSAPQWLYEHYLKDKTVLCVCGTHGKTTTASMLCHILDQCRLNPGFLVGGVPENFKISARSADSRYFVIEGDEYDCAFFDKRAKFVHYHPDIAILNNLEYDHADIYENLAAIQKQFHHLVRTIPSHGTIVVPHQNKAIDEVLAMGMWSNLARVGADDKLHAALLKPDGSFIELFYKDKSLGQYALPITGQYNVNNALMALTAAKAAGISYEDGAKALQSFLLPKRRQELKGRVRGIEVYDDFAHHPTAVKVTLEGMRAHIGNRHLAAVFEPRSNSMKQGALQQELPQAFACANQVYVYASPAVHFDVEKAMASCPVPCMVFHDFDKMVMHIASNVPPDGVILTMSNGSFNGICQKLLKALQDEGQTSDPSCR